MITFQIAGYLTEFTGGRAEIMVDGPSATVGEALSGGAVTRLSAGAQEDFSRNNIQASSV